MITIIRKYNNNNYNNTINKNNNNNDNGKFRRKISLSFIWMLYPGFGQY